MMLRARRGWLQLAFAFVLAMPLLSAAPPARGATLSPYVVTDLGTFGGSYSTPLEINGAGQAVGIAQTSLPDPNYPDIPTQRLIKAFLYENGVLRDPQLNICGSDNALTIDDNGTIFYAAPGVSGCEKTPRLARRDTAGRISFIDIAGDYLQLRDSNNHEQILGNYLDVSTHGYVTFLYENGEAHRIAGPPNHINQWKAINDNGIITGEINTDTITGHAAFIDRGGIHDIHPFPPYGRSTTLDINNNGIIVGTYFDTNRYTTELPRAFTYDTHSNTPHELGAGQAIAINDRGQIIGLTAETAAEGRPALYDGQKFQPLQALIPADSPWQIFTATRINNAGQIIGTGKNANTGETHALILSPRFSDVPPGSPYYTAITTLAGRGIIQGYADGRFGPADLVLRAQSAALIARAVGWDAENWTDKNFPDQGAVDNDLWRNVRALAHYGVAQGYADGTYDPTGPVLHQQTILFIARAFVAKGYWTLADDTNPYPNLPNGTARERDDRRMIATYVAQAGAIPDRPVGGAWADWNTPASRGWYAQVLYGALATLPSTQPVP